jgi:hypothetical protein
MIVRLTLAVLALTTLAFASQPTSPAQSEAATPLDWAPILAQAAGEGADLSVLRLVDSLSAQATNAQSKPKPSRCSASGAPACGGECSIECPTGKRARCVPGSCNPNMPYSCVCERTTYCGCE